MLHDFYTWTSENVGPDTILLLHGHMNQLLALMTAPTSNIVDTSLLFRRAALPSAESSLTQLAETYLPGGLNRTERHSSVDDASLIVELVQWILQNGACHTLHDGYPKLTLPSGPESGMSTKTMLDVVASHGARAFYFGHLYFPDEARSVRVREVKVSHRRCGGPVHR